MKFYQGKTVLVTGASSGIGAAFAREIAKRGANVVLAARRKDLLDVLAVEIEATGAQALAISCDVTRRRDLDEVIGLAKTKFGGVDVVFANAGFAVGGLVENLEVSDFRHQFETNVFGVLETVCASLDELKLSHGSIAIVGSVMGHLSLPGNSPYAMSKFAVTAFAESLWYELKKHRVSVTLISPGFIDSEIRRLRKDGSFDAAAKDPVPNWLMMSAPAAASRIANAIAAGKREEIITFHGKLTVFLYRHLPWLVRIILRSIPQDL